MVTIKLQYRRKGRWITGNYAKGKVEARKVLDYWALKRGRYRALTAKTKRVVMVRNRG